MKNAQSVIVDAYEEFMRAEEFVGKPAEMFEIMDISVETKTSKNNKLYKSYKLSLLGKHGNHIGDKTINFLMVRDLANLSHAWGGDGSKYVGKLVDITAKKEGDFFRWIIHPSYTQKEEIVQ